MTTTHLSPTIALFFDLMEGPDKTRTIDLFAPGAVVTDDGRTYADREAILGWLGRTAGEFSYTSTLLAAEESDGVAMVDRLLEGDFPGGRVQLRYTFDLTPEGLVGELRIAA
ncbi:nuclear transport factor 2 family protein [Labedella endophytica]|jgi:hypothetical protein|uniref:Nuclear transport factor 2 family protein n=1 Tax=Labedella endophytica TaxID=1523160 RepID=A0A433JUR6_9MICO|nr:nuclear transport factor 2 family protein [Labedella endophytica]RUR01916.1 nuclear transport factor 2 family protein [Labedella endophytica]